MPVDDLVVARMEGQPAGLAADGGHDVDVAVAVVLAGEGEPLAVGRELGVLLDAVAGCQPTRDAAVVVHEPEVALVGEYDLVGGDVGQTEQMGRSTAERGGRGRRTGKDSGGEQCHEHHRHHTRTGHNEPPDGGTG